MHSELESCLHSLVARRGPTKSICPSEVARAVDPANWRNHMDDVRELAAQLCQSGELVATQRGKVVDPLTAKGPIRLRMVDH